jgi:hypothetical protein
MTEYHLRLEFDFDAPSGEGDDIADDIETLVKKYLTDNDIQYGPIPLVVELNA